MDSSRGIHEAKMNTCHRLVCWIQTPSLLIPHIVTEAQKKLQLFQQQAHIKAEEAGTLAVFPNIQ